MAYNDFTLDALKQQFGLRTNERGSPLGQISPVEISALLRDILDENVPLALAIGTEKARAELMTMPVLLEVYRQRGQGFSLFSGVCLDVDVEAGLCGVPDFLISLSPEQWSVEAPAVAVVQAKDDNIKTSLGPCIAQMLAMQTFNERRGSTIPTTYGVVTTGSIWMFLQLTDNLVSIDTTEYYIREVRRIVGILVAMVQGISPKPEFLC